MAARARRVLKAKVKEMEKTKETRGRGPAPALLAEHLRATVVAAPDTRLGIRDRSIGLTCFAIAGREHEVAFLRVRDFVETEHGMEVDVRVSKIKPRKGQVPFGSRPNSCPVRAWRAWKEEAGLTDPDDFAYKPLHNRWHTVMPGGLDPETIGDVITRLGKWDALDFRPTGHSPRRGLATSSKRAGNDRKVIAKQGGWVENSAAMDGYFEDGDGWEENALVKVLQGHGRLSAGDLTAVREHVVHAQHRVDPAGGRRHRRGDRLRDRIVRRSSYGGPQEAAGGRPRRPRRFQRAHDPHRFGMRPAPADPAPGRGRAGLDVRHA
ncbi:hypothetical protein AB0D14_40305 [Streptomyces sp. NPDC048484]|uniref:hypothetical protein n=1 Tax=Streptomyces sp. NPDC048484 TaxID=3155146 RepID=UPI00343E8A30